MCSKDVRLRQSRRKALGALVKERGLWADVCMYVCMFV